MSYKISKEVQVIKSRGVFSEELCSETEFLDSFTNFEDAKREVWNKVYSYMMMTGTYYHHIEVSNEEKSFVCKLFIPTNNIKRVTFRCDYL